MHTIIMTLFLMHGEYKIESLILNRYHTDGPGVAITAKSAH